MSRDEPEARRPQEASGTERHAGAAAGEEDRATRLLATVAEVLADLGSADAEEPLLRRITGLIAERFGHAPVSVFLLDHGPGGEQVLWLRAVTGWPALEALVGHDTIPLGEGIIGHAARIARPYLADDVLVDPHYRPVPLPAPRAHVVRSEIAVPIVAQGEVIGVLDVQSGQVGVFTAADVAAYGALAAGAGVAIRQGQFVRRIRQDERRLRAILGAIPDPLVLYDQSWRLEYANDAARRLFRLGDETIGMPIGDLPVGLELFGSDKAAFTVDGVEYPADRSSWQALHTAAEIEIAVGDPPRVFVRRVTDVPSLTEGPAHLAVHHEITESRAAMRAKDRLISIVAHELRTPLTALVGMSDLLRHYLDRDPIDPVVVRTRAERVQREARRMAQLVEHLLGLAQIESDNFSLELGDVHVPALLGRVGERFDTILDGAERLRFSPEMPDITCRWDEGRVEQVLTNLIDNALKYSPSTEPVTIHAEVIPVAGADPDGQGAGRRVRVVVADRGAGMTADELAIAFQPFQRGKRGPRTGLGLGLHVSRIITERHGGNLVLDSAAGEGTRAVLTLPVAVPEPRAGGEGGAA